jgi:squalene cyclase
VGLAAPVVTPATYLASRQQADGGFAEPSAAAFPELTAWAVLGLRARGTDTGSALEYLVAHEGELTGRTSIALVAVAEAALGRDPEALLARLGTEPHAVNEAVWRILARRQARRAAPKIMVNYILRSQARNGGFSWRRGVAPDSNDTAFAVEALRAAGVRGRPITRAVAFLRRLQNRDGGFELTSGRGSDAQSTSVVIQAFVAAGVKPPGRAFSYLARLRRADGSYRYNARYVATPVWVTSQVLPALLRKSLPLH